MCHHKLYIFSICGHSSYGAKPLRICRDASIAPTASISEGCEIKTHAFQSLKIESLCWTCQRRRSELLERIESKQMVRYDEWQWKVSYSAPHTVAGEDDAIDRRLGKEREKQLNKQKSKGRISWKRKSNQNKQSKT